MGRRRQVLNENAEAAGHISDLDAQVIGSCVKSKAENAKESDDAITAAKLMRQLHQAGYRCALSGVSLTPKMSSLDHSIPLSKGGGHVMGNVKFVHPVINRMKGEMTDQEFIDWCRHVVQWTG